MSGCFECVMVIEGLVVIWCRNGSRDLRKTIGLIEFVHLFNCQLAFDVFLRRYECKEDFLGTDDTPMAQQKIKQSIPPRIHV